MQYGNRSPRETGEALSVLKGPLTRQNHGWLDVPLATRPDLQKLPLTDMSAIRVLLSLVYQKHDEPQKSEGDVAMALPSTNILSTACC